MSIDIVQYLKILRIKDWLHLLGLPILGYFYNIIPFNFNEIFFVIVISFLFLAYGFSLNKCANFYRKRKTHIFYKSLLVALAFLLPTLFLAYSISFPAFFIIAVNSFIGFVYSFPPSILKRFPIIVTILNGIGFGLLFSFGYLSNKPIDSAFFYMSSFVGFIFLPVQLVHEIADKTEDRRLGFKSTVMLLDKTTIRYLATLLFALVALFALYINTQISISPLFFASSAAFGLASAFYFWISFDKRDIRTIRITLRYFGIIYGLMLVLVFTNVV